jgi:altronate dehydratase large subunit
MSRAWLGYARPDGRFGTRNEVLVLPGGLMPSRVSEWVPGVRTLTTADRGYGRTARDRQTIGRTLVGLGRNPNVHGVIVWGGDPTGDYDELAPDHLAQAIATSGKPVEVIRPERSGGSFAGLESAVRCARAMVRDASRLRRQPVGLDQLAVGVKCGNSDLTSGQAGNPVVGRLYDLVVAAGGTAVFGETTEIIGAEHELASRAVRPEVGEELLARVAAQRQLAERIPEPMGDVNPIPANRAGGLQTLEQKSRGAVRKSGTMPLQGVLDYGQAPDGPGLYFMDSWMGSLSLPLGLQAAGCTVCLYQLGLAFGDLLDRTGSILAPMLWTTANPGTVAALGDQLDFHAADVIAGTTSIDQAGDRLLEVVLDVASGTLAASETLTWTDPQQIYLVDPPF